MFVNKGVKKEMEDNEEKDGVKGKICFERQRGNARDSSLFRSSDEEEETEIILHKTEASSF